MAQMSLEDIQTLGEKTLSDNGCDAANAAAVARTMTAAERDGSQSHGLFRLPAYVKGLREGGSNGKADPTIEQIAPSVIKVHGQEGFEPLALERANGPLVKLAKEQGIAMCGLTRIRHFAALWPEVEALAEQGLVGFAVTAAVPYVAPAGGREALFGTNPMAFAWPRPDGGMLAFDQAASVIARGDVMIHARDGIPVPEGTGIDKDGNPTTDGQAILDGGVQLAFGGYKGSAIALMIELMAGAMIGEVFSFEAKETAVPGCPFNGGEFLMAIDPSKTAGANFLAHGEKLLGKIEGMEGARLPGARRHANRAKGGPAEVSDKILEAIAAL